MAQPAVYADGQRMRQLATALTRSQAREQALTAEWEDVAERTHGR